MTFPALDPQHADLESLTALPGPAWLWEPASGAMLWGNPAALTLWGAQTVPDLQSLRLDRAMPAVARLRSLAVVLAPGASDLHSLVFWLPGGSRSLVCQCRKVAFPGTDYVLLVQSFFDTGDGLPQSAAREPAPDIRVLNGHAKSAIFEPPRQAPKLAPEDAATLAEIARMVKRRTAPDAALPLPVKDSQPAELERADSGFLARLSHELRTPLNAIIGFAELMCAEQHGPLGNAKYLDYAGNILESAHHCLSLSNDLFDLAALKGGKQVLDFSETDVNDVVRVCLAIAGPIAGKAGVRLADDLASTAPRAILDKRSIRQILLNLIANAIKFTPLDGTVTIRTHYDVGSGLRLSVSDTGRGMTSDGLSRARGLTAEGGLPEANLSGLGLPICHALAQANGGQISIESRTGAGTQVTLTLPMSRLVPL